MRIFILALLLLFGSTAYGNELIPGSYTIEYGGIYKLVNRETNRVLEGQWRDQELNRYLTGDIDFLVFYRRQMQITEHMIDWRNGPPWWTRYWRDSLETCHGGAPPNNSISVRYGKTFKIIDTPLFTVNNAFEFRWRNFQAAIDFQKEHPITVGIGDVQEPRVGWKFDATPIADISFSQLLTNPSKAIQRFGVQINALHTVRGRRILAVEILAWHNFEQNRAFVGVQLALIQW